MRWKLGDHLRLYVCSSKRLILADCQGEGSEFLLHLFGESATKRLNDYRPFYLGVFIALSQFMWPLQRIVSVLFLIIILINYTLPCMQVNRVITEKKRFSGVTVCVTKCKSQQTKPKWSVVNVHVDKNRQKLSFVYVLSNKIFNVIC